MTETLGYYILAAKVEEAETRTKDWARGAVAEFPSDPIPKRKWETSRRCYTCGKQLTIAQAQCSHFIPRAHLGLRWYMPNLKAACETCNVYKDGNIPEYEKKLQHDYPGMPDELRQLAREVSKPSISDLKSLLTEYRYKLEMVKRKWF